MISTVASLCLYLSKTQINDKLSKKLLVPIPFELIIVIIATITSYFAQFKERWGVSIVGNMPLGYYY